MLDLIAAKENIPAMSDGAIEKVRHLETLALQLPQQNIETAHLFHAGIYARTVHIPAGMMITGALIKIPTLLIVSGDVLMFVGGETRELRGYHVLAASAGRKQAFIALSDACLTMLFPTAATTVECAEAAFTDETDLLISRRPHNANIVTTTGK